MFRRDFLKVAPSSFATALLPGVDAEKPASASSGPRAIAINVLDFGALGDGKNLDSPAINRAIEAAALSGGGTVYFPAGTYLSYTLRLKSHINLHLDSGATILAASVPSEGTATGGYDPAGPKQPWEAFQDFGHNHWANSLIYGEDLEYVSISGSGLIWGKGLSRGMQDELPLAESPGVGNKAIALKKCRNVSLRDFSILSGGHFAILLTGVDNVLIDGLTLDTNRDGIDIDCCRNVRVSNCIVNSPWDDGIVPKSSFALGEARATENLLITNCHVTGAYVIGTLLDGTLKPIVYPDWRKPIGRIKCGTESNGGFKNITIANSIFDTCRGLALLVVDGGVLEDVSINNLTMRNVNHPPLTLRLGQRMSGPNKKPAGALRRVRISQIVSSNASAEFCSIIAGVPGMPIEDVSVSDVFFEQAGGGTEAWAQRKPPEKADGYPDADMFGISPASGFFIRHAKNIQLNNVEIAVRQPDQRAAIWASEVDGLDVFRLKAPSSAPCFSLDRITNLRTSNTWDRPDRFSKEIITETF
ncbi:MAG TPA: glycoside hydrolase family 28 protein [Bryobacteraceae bacterium]